MTSPSYEKLVCPNCHGKLNKDKLFTCTRCSTSYPLLDDLIPVLHPRPAEHLAGSFYQFEQIIKKTERKIHQAERSPAQANHRRNLEIVAALRSNLEYYHKWRGLIANLTNRGMLVDIAKERRPLHYGSTFSYLIRDWSTAKENKEILIIEDHLEQAIRKISSPGAALFLGAGTGRLAVDLRHHFSSVSAVELSLFQISQFFEIQRGKINVFELQTINQRHSKEMVLPINAAMTEEQRSKSSDILFVNGDAHRTPFADHAFECVISVHFTEVLPLSHLLPEVKRILRPGGYFIHCGPLQYHFDDLAEHYSYDEFQAVMAENSFFHEGTEEFVSPIDYSSNRLHQAEFINKLDLFHFKPPALLDHGTCLSINQEISYRHQGTIGGNNEMDQSTTIELPDGKVLEQAEALVDFLQLIDAAKSFADLLEEFQQEYQLLDSDKNELISSLEILIRYNVIKIT